MAIKISLVKPLLKNSSLDEETKMIRIKIPVSKYEVLIENSKLTGMKPDQLLLMAADKTDVFEIQGVKSTTDEEIK